MEPPLKYGLAPLGLGGVTLVGWFHDYWPNGVGKFLRFSLLNPRVTTHFSTMFISILFGNWNTLTNVGWVGCNKMAFHTQCLSSLSRIPYQNGMLGLLWHLVSPWSTYAFVHRLFSSSHGAYVWNHANHVVFQS